MPSPHNGKHARFKRKAAGAGGDYEIDRFGTLRRFIDVDVPKLTRETGSTSAGLALVIIWGLADGHTGKLFGLSVTRLAMKMGVDLKTARKALGTLVQRDYMVADGKPKRVPAYTLRHDLKG
ncbi:unnamed protein product [Gemmataceae bacterium]|nr:unnamed protein product [Gemmataceae bacterium]VTU02449.1 unnamed protein product [Gemmataceae bacterium]